MKVFLSCLQGISAAYVSMRSKQSQKNLPVTARSLETLIRLASAHAKARLSASVDEEDVEVAVELMNFVLFHEVGDTSNVGIGPGVGADSRGNLMTDNASRGKKGRTQAAPHVSDGDDDEGDGDDDLRRKRGRVGGGSASAKVSDSSGSNDYDEYANEEYIEAESNESKAREKSLLQEVIRFSQDQEAETFALDDAFIAALKLIPSVFISVGSPSMSELIRMLRNIEKQNKVCLSARELTCTGPSCIRVLRASQSLLSLFIVKCFLPSLNSFTFFSCR